MTVAGRHYETGTIADALAAMGAIDPKSSHPYSEALALGASGGIAFGYFVFEYTGHLPHVALLTRNTFAPFERALDNLGMRREVRETTSASKGEENLRFELDAGNPVLVWADIFSLPHRGLDPRQMWHMRPLLVLGYDGGEYEIADGASQSIRISASDLAAARARVKKDRFRIMVLEHPVEGRLVEGLRQGIRTCTALFLDKPPAGSTNNFGFSGMRYWAKMLADERNAKGWPRTFEPGPRLVQALAGTIGQPGVWDWIETWGTGSGADRGVYAQFLREASVWLNQPQLGEVASAFDRSAVLWSHLAEAAMPDFVPEFKELKALKHEQARAYRERGQSDASRVPPLVEAVSGSDILAQRAGEIREEMARLVLEIAKVEEAAVRELRGLVG